MLKNVEVAPHERAEILIFFGLVGAIGCFAPILTTVWSAMVAEHDFVASTLSDLGRGPHKIIMDVGFYICACGLVSLAIAAAHVPMGGMGWSAGILCLATLALLVSMIGLFDQFKNEVEPGETYSVHTWISFGLGPLYLIGPLGMARGAARVSRIYSALFVLAAVIWIVFAGWYLMAPTAYDGIIEKTAIFGTLLWTTPLAYIFVDRGRCILKEDPAAG